jgi:hypothetical protein
LKSVRRTAPAPSRRVNSSRLDTRWDAYTKPRQGGLYGRERLHVRLENVRHAVWQRDVADLVPLRRSKHKTLLRYLHLIRDVQPAGIETDAVDWQPENLPFSQPATGSEVNRVLQ